MELAAKKFTTAIRFEAAGVAVLWTTMGKKLISGEKEGLLHAYASSTRSEVAEEIIQLIYPPKATDAAKLRAKRKYFLSESILPMANCIVGELGKVNIGLGIVGTQSSGYADIPHYIFPLAAMVVSCFVFSLLCTTQVLVALLDTVRDSCRQDGQKPAARALRILQELRRFSRAR